MKFKQGIVAAVILAALITVAPMMRLVPSVPIAVDSPQTIVPTRHEDGTSQGGSLLTKRPAVREEFTPSPPFTSQGRDTIAAQWAQNINAAKPNGATPTTTYVTRMEDVLQEYIKANQQQSGSAAAAQSHGQRPFKFHVYDIPRKYIEGAIEEMEARWATSFCNRHKVKTNYTMLDWRHAHSLFTVDVFMAKYLRYHPSHTTNPAEADVFIIPMMTHVYNCAGVLQKYSIEIISWLVQYPYYKVYNNHDHFLFWWRWGMHFNSVNRFWKRVQQYLPNVNLISFDLLELQGRNEFQDFSLALKPKFLQSKFNIVVPYPEFSPYLLPGALPQSWEEQASYNADPANRDILFFFAGTSTIGGIRRWIKRACEANTKDCVFQDFAGNVIDPKRLSVPKEYPKAMKKSVFCGHAAGDALSSRRPTSAVLAGCIPVMVCDLCLYAWENFINYERFAVFVTEDDVMNGKLFDILKAIPQERIAAMQKELYNVRKHFVYHVDGPPQQDDALDMIVRELELRGMTLRSYRRWFTFNHRLSANMKDYPVDPPAVKKYLRKGAGSSAKEEKDFNNLG